MDCAKEVLQKYLESQQNKTSQICTLLICIKFGISSPELALEENKIDNFPFLT